jgi:hypothetical protein
MFLIGGYTYPAEDLQERDEKPTALPVIRRRTSASAASVESQTRSLKSSRGYRHRDYPSIESIAENLDEFAE